MGIMDKIRGMLGGDSVGGYAPKDDDDDKADGDAVEEELARERVQADIDAERYAEFDRISDADGSGGKGDYRP